MSHLLENAEPKKEPRERDGCRRHGSAIKRFNGGAKLRTLPMLPKIRKEGLWFFFFFRVPPQTKPFFLSDSPVWRTMTIWGESNPRSKIARCRLSAHLINLIGARRGEEEEKKKENRKQSPAAVFQVPGFGKQILGKISYFPLDLTLDRFSDPTMVSKLDKQPQRERKWKFLSYFRPHDLMLGETWRSDCICCCFQRHKPK